MINLKRSWLFILIFLFLLGSLGLNSTSTQAAPFDLDAESAILIEATTGKVLFEKNADIALPPASMSKMMSEYLILEALENGQFDWDTLVPVSEYANFIQGSTVFLHVGEERTVRDLMVGLAAFSGNDATVALAEFVAGSEAHFVQMMNDKAAELGMTQTRFVNASGLSNSMLGSYIAAGTADEENSMSARDTAILARALVNDFPHVLEYSSEFNLPEAFGDYQLYNFNLMLAGHPLGEARPHAYPGLDGLKTGFTELAQYCFTGTAERDGMRLITVVMQSESATKRFEETKVLLDYGFTNFVFADLAAEGDALEGLEVLPVHKGKQKEVKVALGNSISSIIHKDEEHLYSLEYTFHSDVVDEEGNIIAPIEEGAVIGEIHLAYSGNIEYDTIQNDNSEYATLISLESVERAGWFSLVLRSIGDFFGGIWNGITGGITGWFS